MCWCDLTSSFCCIVGVVLTSIKNFWEFLYMYPEKLPKLKLTPPHDANRLWATTNVYHTNAVDFTQQV